MNIKDLIIYEDKYIIVINKPSHLLTISTDKEQEKTLFHEVLMYERKKNKHVNKTETKYVIYKKVVN